MDVTAAVRASPAAEGLPITRLDLLEPASLAAAFDTTKPDAVLHAAALADPDCCQREPDLAWRLNAEAPAALARLSARGGVRLVALSTDLVFRGDRPFSSEADEPVPVLHYARTKLEGERSLLAEDPRAAVARVALVVGRGHGARGTASETIAWALRARRRLRLFTDQLRTPVDPESVAAAVAVLLRGTQAGLFHLGGPERISRHELGLRVAVALGLDRSLIDASRQAEMKDAAPRPLDVSLDSSRARRELGFAPRPLDAALRDGRPSPPGL